MKTAIDKAVYELLTDYRVCEDSLSIDRSTNTIYVSVMDDDDYLEIESPITGETILEHIDGVHHVYCSDGVTIKHSLE